LNNHLFTLAILGPLLLILSLLFKYFPPKTINYWYGYRTIRSMKSSAAWNCANQYCANAFIVVACLTCLVQVITYALLDIEKSIFCASIFMVIGIVLCIPLTEIHLKKKGF
jgi:uncharacterized membrane protein